MNALRRLLRYVPVLLFRRKAASLLFSKKVESKLQEEIGRIIRSRSDERITVIIVCKGPIISDRPLTPGWRSIVQNKMRQIQAVQKPVVKALLRADVPYTDITPHKRSSSVTVLLRPLQLREVIKMEQVEALRLSLGKAE